MQREQQALGKAKKKLSIKKRLAKEAKVTAKHRLREERSQFWPRKVYQVVLTLDTNWELSTQSSRRESIDNLMKPTIQSVSRASPSMTTPGSSSVQHTGQISLLLSYSTHAASWSPRYDLSLSTSGRSGTITYHAEFSNRTSESWRDAKVIISTSQTNYQSLSEPIPILARWQIRLSKSNTSTNGDEALVSRHELAYRHKGGDLALKSSDESRHTLFGVDGALPNGAVAPFENLTDERQNRQIYQSQLLMLAQQQQRRQQMAQQ